MTAFSRELLCEDCGREYLVSGTVLDTGSQTEALAYFRCSCGHSMGVFVPSSVPRDRLIVTLSGSHSLDEEAVLESLQPPAEKKTA